MAPAFPPPPGPPPSGTDDEPITYLPDLPPEALEIAATGDVNLGGTVGDVIASAGPDYPWRRVSDLLGRADIALVNLECSVSTLGTPYPKQYTFRADPATLPAMRNAGVDVVSLANNHSLDYGPEALLDTMAHLRAAGIASVGAGANDAEAWSPHVVTAKGIRVAFVAASRVIPHESWAVTADRPGIATAYSDRRLLSEVRRAGEVADVVVVSVHWGVERTSTPEEYQVTLGRRLVDAGATVVIGHHPHVLQPVVRYRGGIIAYSLGNFVFTAPDLVQQSMVLRIGILPDGQVVASQTPIQIVGGQPRPV